MSDLSKPLRLHQLSKRDDARLTLGLALGFGGVALLLTGIISFLFGYYFGRRKALKILGGRRGNYSAVGLAVDNGAADGLGSDTFPMRRSNKLRSSSSNGPRTASTYSYTGLNNTDGDSTFSGRNNNNNNFLSATSMQVEMPAMTSALDPEPPATNAGTQGMYGSWYGGRPAPVLPSPSMYVEPPPEQHSSSAPGNTLRPSNLRPGSRFGHGTPLAQISEGSTPMSTTRPPIQPPTPGPELRNPYDTGNNLAVSEMHVEMPTLSPADPLTRPVTTAPPSTSTMTSTLPSTRSGTPATFLNNNSTAANVVRTNTTSQPPSYPFHELASNKNRSSGSGTPSSRGEGISSSASPQRRYSRILGPRAQPTQIPVESSSHLSPMYVEMPNSSPSAPGYQ